MKVAVWRGLDSRGLGGKVLRAFIMQVSAWGCPGEDKELGEGRESKPGQAGGFATQRVNGRHERRPVAGGS